MLTQWSTIWHRIMAILDAFSPIKYTRTESWRKVFDPSLFLNLLSSTSSQLFTVCMLFSAVKLNQGHFYFGFSVKTLLYHWCLNDHEKPKKNGGGQELLSAHQKCLQQENKQKLFQEIFKQFCFRVFRSFCLKIIWSFDKEWKRRNSI